MSIDYKEAGHKGRSLIWEQRWEDAVRAFQIAISGLPNEPDLYDGLATAYRGLNELDKALENYQMAARLSKGEAIYMEQVADVQEQLGQHKSAAQTYMVLGEMKLRDRRLDEAVDRWLMAASLDPGLLKVHQRLAAVYARQKQIEQAVNEYMTVARLLEKQNDPGRALEACQSALKLDSRNPDVRTAIELLQHGERAFADEQEIADAVRPRRLETLLGEEKPKRRIITTAVEAQRLARERLAEEIFADTGLGDEMARMQRMTLISQALDYQTRGLLNEAIDGYEQAIRTGLNSTAAYYNLGLLYLERNLHDKAQNAFNRAVEDPAYRLGSHFGLMEVYRAKGDLGEAVRNGILVLREVDLATLPASKHGRAQELYTSLEQDLLGLNASDKTINFCNALIDFLGVEKWQAQVSASRERLNRMAGDGDLMIMGDILTAGSSQVLELLYQAQEHSRAGLYATAMEEAYRAIGLSPNYLPAHMQMADLLLKQQRVSAATQKFLVLGRAYQTRGDLNGAFHAFERAV
ncbi:MAG: tetratricopeptide repeat protein, partial [Anaerolineales bacterium]|nr:tetratricopeptide repeat protein [Anaerolineales bacterium]